MKIYDLKSNKEIKQDPYLANYIFSYILNAICSIILLFT